MAQALLGIALLVFGVASILDARRIGSTIRRRGTLDIVGPDGYLLGVGVLLLLLGVLLALQAWLQWRRAAPRDAGAAAAAAAAATATADEGGYAHFALIAALLGYAVLLPIAGYAASTVVFLLAVFRIMGVRSWARSAAGALALTILFYVAFTRVADLPLPRGWHGLG